MTSYYLTIFFASLIVGMECRSIVSSNLDQYGMDNDEVLENNLLSNATATEDFDSVINFTTLNQALMDKNWKDYSRDLNLLIATQVPSVENLLSAFVFKTVNITDQGTTIDHWLKQLKPVMDAFSIQIARTSTEPTLHQGNSNAILIEGNNWLGGLREILDEQYFDSENSEDNDSNVESKLSDSSTSESSIDQSFEEIEDNSTNKNEPDKLNNQLNDISETQKHFGKLCRKHRTE